jgi:PAS domain S-box-containing protein
VEGGIQNKLLQRQLAKAKGEGGDLDLNLLLSLIQSAYEEAEKERRLTDRAMALMSEELLEVNQGLRQHAQNLVAMQERYILAAEGANDGLWDWDLETGRVYYADRWKEIIGYPPSEKFETLEDWLTRVHLEYAKTVRDLLNEHLGGNSERFECEYLIRHQEGHHVWVLTRGLVRRDRSGSPVRMAGSQTDISKRKEAEEKLKAASEQLATAARVAGMAEAATNVLHNVGNILNTVNTTASILSEKIEQSNLAGLIHLKKLIHQHPKGFIDFASNDPRGKLLPQYLCELSDYWEEEKSYFENELFLLNQNISHIKDCIAMQQSIAGTSGMVEPTRIIEIINSILLLKSGAFKMAQIEVEREFEQIQPSLVDRIKFYQIFMNLMQNARHALLPKESGERKIFVKVTLENKTTIHVIVRDNGVGIPKENLTKIFNHGFTTKKNGHGFGLHYCALAAREMGGDLRVESGGVNKGATFTLILPYIPIIQQDEKS